MHPLAEFQLSHELGVARTKLKVLCVTGQGTVSRESPV